MTGLAPMAPDQPSVPAVLDQSGRLRFLLIEDSTTNSALVRALLEEEFPDGHVDLATSLDQALNCLAESGYDMILADLTLPEAEGEMVARTVRGLFPQTALMLLTGRVDGTLALWTPPEGAPDCLVADEHNRPCLAEALRHGLQRTRTEEIARARLASALELERKVAEQLRALETARNDFVATASHELRTPLTSIAACAEMLEEEVGLTSRQAEFVAVIVRNAARLTALTEDLNMLSGFNSTQTHMERLEVDLRAVVDSAAEVLAALGAGKHLQVCLDLPRRPVLVMGDARQLERVVMNLMSNAVKFTDRGTVTCRLSCTATEVFLSVIDTGMGIPPTEQAQLFTKFFRGSEARQRAVQGSGLGLHVAASIVCDHGGDISVDSVAGRGTTFTVRLRRVESVARQVSGPDPGLRVPS